MLYKDAVDREQVLSLEGNTPASSFSNHQGGNVIHEFSPYDVMCGRHKAAFNNIGNRRFRVTVSLSLARYVSAATRKDKSIVIKSVAALVRSTGGRFVHCRKGAWVELTEKQAHDKVGHALRDMAMAASKQGEAASTASTRTGTSSSKNTPNQVSQGTVPNQASQRTIPDNIEVTATSTSLQEEHTTEWSQHSDDPAVEPQDDGEFPVPEGIAEPFPLDPTVLSSSSQQGAATDESLLVSDHEAPHEPQDHHRCSMNNDMLSWLINESDSLLSGGLLLEEL